MECVLLADYPGAAGQVARWYYDQWLRPNPAVTLERVEQKVATFVQRDTAPLLALAKQGDQFIGAAELKIREMDIYPEKEFWLGGVYVAEHARGQGVAARLVKEVLKRARQAGIEQLFLQTEQLDGGLYRRLGFFPLEEVDYKGYHVLVMQADVIAKAA